MISILIVGVLQIVAMIIWIIIYLVCVGPIIMGGYYYYKFLRYPSYDTKKTLPRAHLYNIISICLQFALFTIFGLALGNGKPLPIGGFSTAGDGATVWIYNVISLVINAGLNYYWMGVTARYANM